MDVEGFGDHRRTNRHQVAVRDGLYRAIRQAFHEAGIPYDEDALEDRGDGVFILIPAEVPKGRLADLLLAALATALHAHNDKHPRQEQIRLRMALHAGEVNYDGHGVTAAAVNLAFRLVDAAPLKTALANSPGVLAVIVSAWFFEEVVRHSAAGNAATYRPIAVAVKETATVGWICLPDHPFPPDDAMLDRSPEVVAVPGMQPTTVLRTLPDETAEFAGPARETDWLVTTVSQTGANEMLQIQPQLQGGLEQENSPVRAGTVQPADLAHFASRQAEPAQRSPDGSSTNDPPAGSNVPVPHQLPTHTSHFAGRECELAALTALLNAAGMDGTVLISAIEGTAGIGKTALALHWAHQVAGRFRDGQLYVNLRGFDPAGPPVQPADALQDFLEAFGVSPERIPATVEARAALYRSLLAGRQVLVVLDNACDIGQVRPLLPASPGCLAVVTSRSQLLGLIVAEGARPLMLDLLTVGEAWELLARRLGPERLANEPQVAGELIELCARLPLALAIVAARAATQPDFPLAVLAAALRHARGRLDALDGGDVSANVRADAGERVIPGAGEVFPEQVQDHAEGQVVGCG